MGSHLIITFSILGGAIILFLSNRVRADLVALLVVFALGISGVLTPEEAFSGFSRSAVITIMSVFILSEGIQRAGITKRLGNLILRLGGKNEHRLVVTVMIAAASMSLFMNNIAAASVLLPAVSRAGRKAGVYPSRLLMPLAFATILGGMATLLTTTNIIVSSMLRERGLEGLSIVDFLPVGLPIVVVGVAYMAFWGRRLLPAHSLSERVQARRREEGDLVDFYRLGVRLFRARVPVGSNIVGKTLAQSSLRETYGLNVIAVERGAQVKPSPAPDTLVHTGDILLLEGNLADFRQRDVEPYLEILPPRDWRRHDLESTAIVVAEVMLTPRSSLVNQTLHTAHFREKYGMTALALWRAGEQVYDGLADLPLQFGDAMLIQGPRERLSILRDETDLILLTDEEQLVPQAVGIRGIAAVLILAITLVGAALKPALVGEIMLGGALAMMLTGILAIDEAYAAIEWRSVFLVAGMLPIGLAMTKTGAASLLADRLIATLGSAGPLTVLAGLFLAGTLLTQLISGAAVAILLGPIAINVAQHMGANPRSMAMGVALAASMAFLTPLGHPVNVLMMGPGGYSFRDYFKVGLPLTLLLFVVVLVLLPWFWPFG